VAIENARLYDEARRVAVTVSAGTDLSLTVRDNGSGMKDLARRSGLANLEQRATKLGGTFRIEPAQGGGTELEWRVPLALSLKIVRRARRLR
jgi:signal transduction histidine kinase